LNAPTAYDYVQALYRLIAVQSGSTAVAESTTREIFLEAFERSGRQLERVDFDGLFRVAFERRAKYPQNSESQLSGWPQKLHLLPEPERSSVTLFYLEVIYPAVIAEITGTTLESLAGVIDHARRELGYQPF
jgi:DNA-directed RNA polymerase specialized sigma24 family protein